MSPTALKVTDLPKALNIFGRKFRVELTDELDEETYGETIGHEYLIRMNKHCPAATAAQTLFHESLHAFLHVSGQSELMDADKEESLVIMLENALGPHVDIWSYEWKEASK